MAACSVIFRLLFLLVILSASAVRVLSAGLGINYGQIANNLPSPSRVSVMLQSLNVSRLKLYDADPNVLLAFSNSNVEFVIGLGNEYLQDMTDPIKAQNWVQQHLQPHITQTKITCITVGNEVFMSNDTQLWSNLLPAMKMVYNTLVNLGLDKQVIVTSAHSFNIIGNSYPPSSGTFRQDLAEYIQAILNFHSQINSPFLINAYPFFAYKDNPDHISLEYALFQPNPGMIDPNTNLHYDNMLFAQVDAVYSAIKAMGHTDIEVMISETGWPSKGDPDEIGSTPENAALYHSNLLNRIQAKQGTPAKPSVPMNIYVFALFNENLKPGPTSERNYGLFYPDGTPVYSSGLQGYLPGIVYYSSASTINNYVRGGREINNKSITQQIARTQKFSRWLSTSWTTYLHIGYLLASAMAPTRIRLTDHSIE
uniref:glucan endo-1,3-beta-D-glucosidase n=1 Tax=Salix viminalis TaxID=40686 RepID=A0A6N2LL94_SALVM